MGRGRFLGGVVTLFGHYTEHARRKTLGIIDGGFGFFVAEIVSWLQCCCDAIRLILLTEVLNRERFVRI